MPPVSLPAVALEGPVSLLKFSWDLFKVHWKILVAISVVPQVFNYAGTIIQNSGNSASLIIGVILLVISAILGIAGLVAMIDAVQRLSADETAHISLTEQYKKGFRSFWSLIFIGILAILVTLGSFLLLIIPGIIVVVYTSVYLYTFVVDGKKGFSALGESYTLVRGRWWPVLGRLLFLALVSIVIMVIVGFVVSGIGALVGGIQSFMAVSGLANLIAGAIMGPIAYGYTYRLYVSLKSTRKDSVQVGAFKKWLVAFLVIGIVGIPVIILSVSALAIAKVVSSPEVMSNLKVQLQSSGLTDEQMSELEDAINRSTEMEASAEAN